MALVFTVTGEVRIDGELVGSPQFTRSRFRAAFPSRLRPELLEADQGAYALAPIHSDGVWLYVSVWFRGEAPRLLSLGASTLPPEQCSWEQWSMEREAASKRYLEHSLLASLGAPHEGEVRTHAPAEEYLNSRIGYAYSWGTVEAGFDPRGAAAGAWIWYGGKT